jgi:hypothetical protein
MRHRYASIISAALVAFVFLASVSPQVTAQGGTTGQLKVKADPGRAGVFVDGKYVGPAANFGRTRTYTVPAGSHEVVLREPRYREATLKTTIEAGKTTTVEQRLEPLPEATPPFGKLKTTGAAKYTAVYINGVFIGHADEFDNFAQSIQIKPGDYQVRLLSADGARTHEEKVTVTENETTEVRWPAK